MLTVQQLLDAKPASTIWSVAPQQMVIDAIQIMADQNIGAVVVMEGEKLVGIFSERDYVRKGIVQGRKSKTTPVAEVMTPNVFTVSPRMDISHCMQLFSQKHIRHLPVMQDERVVGVLSISDIVNSIINEQASRIEFLEKYLSD
jgi:CBS domain-containing protein